MAGRGLSISVKLILVSTLVVAIAIGLFGFMNVLRSRRLIDHSSRRVQQRIVDGLRQAGTAQLQLLTETTRIALVQSDYTTLQATVENTAVQDERITTVAVVDRDNTFLAHSERARAGKKAAGPMLKLLRAGAAEGTRVGEGDRRALVFTAPVVHEGEAISSVYVAYTLESLRAELLKARRLKAQEGRDAIKATLLIGALSVLLGAVLAILQGVRISRPIQALARQANQIAAGDLLARVEIRSHDEIGFLGDQFNYMADQVMVLMRETSEKATMEKELEVASAIQSTLVPQDALIELDGLSLASYFEPATQCGGDWWSYYELAGGKILVIIGDVTGHGVASAMITAAAKGAATALIAASGGQLGLRELLINMNAAIHDAAKGRFVMTCFASIYDPATGRMDYANAGHTFPYIKDGQSGRLASLVSRGNRLGDVVDSDFAVRDTTIAPGSVLVWYTDGIVECVDVRGQEYGERRFRNSIKKAAELPVGDARDEIVQRAAQFFGDVPREDDITLIIAKFAG